MNMQNLTVRFSKFALNIINIYDELVGFLSKLNFVFFFDLHITPVAHKY